MFTKPQFHVFLNSLNSLRKDLNAHKLGEFLRDIDKKLAECNKVQLEQFNDKFQEYKKALNNHLGADKKLTKEQKQLAIQFLNAVNNALNAKLNGKSENTEQAPRASSYVPSASPGQSIYESMTYLLGHSPETVGSSAMFFIAFLGVRFILESAYWEQVAEYNAAPGLQFNPNKLSMMQIAKGLTDKSTPAKIIQAGFLPKPDLDQALELELKNFSLKMGNISEQSKQSALNPLGANMARGIKI